MDSKECFLFYTFQCVLSTPVSPSALKHLFGFQPLWPVHFPTQPVQMFPKDWMKTPPNTSADSSYKLLPYLPLASCPAKCTPAVTTYIPKYHGPKTFYAMNANPFPPATLPLKLYKSNHNLGDHLVTCVCIYLFIYSARLCKHRLTREDLPLLGWQLALAAVQASARLLTAGHRFLLSAAHPALCPLAQGKALSLLTPGCAQPHSVNQRLLL